MSKSQNEGEVFDPVDICEMVEQRNGQGVGGGPKGEWKWTISVIKKELEDMYKFCFHGFDVVQKNPYTGQERTTKTYPVHLKELAIGRGYSWKNFRDAISELNVDKYKAEKKSFSATIEMMREAIEMRLHKKGLERGYDASIVRLSLTANFGRVTDRSVNDNSHNFEETSKEKQDKVDKLIFIQKHKGKKPIVKPVKKTKKKS